MYTKGKWQHIEDGVILAEDGRQIASVFPRDRTANANLIAAAPVLYEALVQIAKGEGRFSRDPLTHASNTIEDMKLLAKSALALAEGKEVTK